jgi:hypothetical protein
MTFMNENYQQYKAMYDAATQHNKAAVVDALTAASITTLTAEFDGYGDSGQIESITAQAGDSVVELPKTAITIRVVTNVRRGDHDETIEKVEQQPLAEAIEVLCYDYLEERHGGWEINDGSFGRFEFDVTSRIVTLEFTQRSSDFSSEEF